MIILRIHDHTTLYLDGKEIRLTPIESKILKYLMDHKNHVQSREQILTYVWGGDARSTSNVVDVHVKNLRRKLKVRKNRPIVETMWGHGYRFNDAGVQIN